MVQFLTFTLADKKFAIEVTKVREMIQVPEISFVPSMPHYVLGVIDLRGLIIPVIDFKVSYELESFSEYDLEQFRSCLIIVETKHDFGKRSQTAILVDSVKEVIDISKEQIEKANLKDSKIPMEHIRGVHRSADEFFILLNIEKALEKQITEV